MNNSLIIDRRFRGPPDSGNGGYTCGVVASLLDGDVEVTLRSPPPLDRPFDVVRLGEGVQVRADGVLVAEARPTTVDIEAPAPPSFEEAIRASEGYPWRETHPYPTCFVCGPERAPRDGLCIYPGAVGGRDIAAAPFVPDHTLSDNEGRLRREIVWASLDCPSWFGFRSRNVFDGQVLVGRLAAHIESLPRIEERCICVGWFLGRDGRKINCGSALYSEHGALLAFARATWITLK